MRPNSLNQETRKKHQIIPELVGGLDLSPTSLLPQAEEMEVSALIELLNNAEYWLSYEPESFDPAVLLCPSPIRELGIGIALRFGHSLNGNLATQDIQQCRELLSSKLPGKLAAGLENGLQTLTRTLETRNAIPNFEEDGFCLYQPSQTLSIHALRASGRATIKLDGRMVSTSKTDILLGEPIRLSAIDEQARPLELPEITTQSNAPIYARDSLDKDYRECVFTVPGLYRITVPSKPEGGHKLFVA